MKITGKKYHIVLIIASMMSFIELATAGAQSGHPQSLDQDIKQPLEQSLHDAGYYCRDIEKCISAYLWDNRQMLLTTDIAKQRQVDLVICILTKKGSAHFSRYARPSYYSGWCEEQLR